MSISPGIFKVFKKGNSENNKIFTPLYCAGIFIVSAVLLAGIFKFNVIKSPTLENKPASILKSPLKLLGTPPPQSATDDIKERFLKRVSLLAQQTDTITIGAHCALSPSIVIVKTGTSLIFKNQDDDDHILYTTEDIKTKAGEDTIVNANFKGPGSYSITCQNSGIVGFLYLTE